MIFRRFPESRGLRGVHEQRAADRDLALELLGKQLVPPGGRLPGDHLGRVAGDVVAQVKQLAPSARPFEPVHPRRGEDVELLGPAALPLGPGQPREDQVRRPVGQQRAVVEEPLPVRDPDPDAFEPQLTG